MATAPSHLLRLSLRANAGFSLSTGLLLALAPATVGDWLGVDINNWLRVLGIALIGHAAILELAARQDQPEALAKINVLMIAPYPLLMVGFALAVIDSGVGQALLVTDGAIVGVLALAQVVGLRKLHS